MFFPISWSAQPRVVGLATCNISSYSSSSTVHCHTCSLPSASSSSLLMMMLWCFLVGYPCMAQSAYLIQCLNLDESNCQCCCCCCDVESSFAVQLASRAQQRFRRRRRHLQNLGAGRRHEAGMRGHYYCELVGSSPLSPCWCPEPPID